MAMDQVMIYAILSFGAMATAVIVFYFIFKKKQPNWYEQNMHDERITLSTSHMASDYNASLPIIPEHSLQSSGKSINLNSNKRNSIPESKIIKNDNAINCKLGHVYGSNKRIDLIESKDSTCSNSQEFKSSQMSIQSNLSYNRRPSYIASEEDNFWVPNMDKKRALSLTPNLLNPPRALSKSRHNSYSGDEISCGSREDDLPSVPPPGWNSASGSGTQRAGSTRSRRRASMQDALDFTQINANMYEKEQPAEEFRYKAIYEESFGRLNLSIMYSSEQGLLTVKLREAVDLVGKNELADSYCRITLLPYHRMELQSKLQKKTLSPQFKEEFIFDIPSAQLSSFTLQVLVFDFDQFSMDECIGQVLVPLANHDLSKEVSMWQAIYAYNKNEEQSLLGEVMFSLSYLFSAERLTMVILKARNLQFEDETKSITNTLAKVSISTQSGKKLKKKRTTVIRNSGGNPTWNEALTFSVPRSQLREAVIELTVASDSQLGHSEPIGHVTIGPDVSGDERAHWNDMQNSKTAMARWHQIHPVKSVS